MSMVDEAAFGTATVHIEPKSTKPIHGCFVKRTPDLDDVIKNAITDQEKYESSPYLFYSFLDKEFQGVVTNISYMKISKDKNSMELAKCPLENNPLVIQFNGHFFLCCDIEIEDKKNSKKSKFLAFHGHFFLCCDSEIEDKKNSKKSNFLEEHSTEFRIHNKTLGSEERFCVLSKKDYLKFIPFNMAQCQSQSNIYRILQIDQKWISEILVETGPLLRIDDETKFLVGGFRKISHDSKGNCRFQIDMFGKCQGNPPSDSPSPNGPEENPPPPNGPEENPPPPNGPEENPPPPNGPEGNPPPPNGPEENPPPPNGPEENPPPPNGPEENPPPPNGPEENPPPPNGPEENPPPPNGPEENPPPPNGPEGNPPPPNGLEGNPPPPNGPEENPPPPNGPEGNPPPPNGLEGNPPPPNGPEGNPPPPNGLEGNPPPPNGPEENPPPPNVPEGAVHDPNDRNIDNIDGIPVGAEQQVYLKDFFERDAENIKALARLLDRRSFVLKNYEHLADLLKAPALIKAKCKSNSTHSPTLDLLQMSKVSSLSVNALVGKLREISRNDVANEIEKRIPDQREFLTVKEAINNHGELFEEVADCLDNTKINNWKTLGGKLGFKRDELNQIGLGCNPTERLLEDYAYPTMRAEQLTVGRFRELVIKIERDDILKLLQESGITEQDNAKSIKDVIPPQSKIMWKLCLELNKEIPGLKNWKHLAFEWGISHDTYSQFNPNQNASPTEILLLEWLIGERPEFTVNALCHLLGEIKRNDARKILEDKLKDYC